MSALPNHDALVERIRRDLIDSYDEELELEIEDSDASGCYADGTEAPWWVVQAVDKKSARLNCIRHLLDQFDYHEVERTPVVLPERVRNPDYIRQPVPGDMIVPEVY